MIGKVDLANQVRLDHRIFASCAPCAVPPPVARTAHVMLRFTWATIACLVFGGTLTAAVDHRLEVQCVARGHPSNLDRQTVEAGRLDGPNLHLMFSMRRTEWRIQQVVFRGRSYNVDALLIELRNWRTWPMPRDEDHRIFVHFVPVGEQDPSRVLAAEQSRERANAVGHDEEEASPTASPSQIHGVYARATGTDPSTHPVRMVTRMVTRMSIWRSRAPTPLREAETPTTARTAA